MHPALDGLKPARGCGSCCRLPSVTSSSRPVQLRVCLSLLPPAACTAAEPVITRGHGVLIGTGAATTSRCEFGHGYKIRSHEVDTAKTGIKTGLDQRQYELQAATWNYSNVLEPQTNEIRICSLTFVCSANPPRVTSRPSHIKKKSSKIDFWTSTSRLPQDGVENRGKNISTSRL